MFLSVIPVLSWFVSCSSWWEYTDECRLNSEEPSDTTELNMKHAAGIFFVLAAGVLLAILIALIERQYRNLHPKIFTTTNKKVYV